jgi:hypothetical protein
MVVELKVRVSGFGEATSNPYYNITIETITTDLEKIRPLIEKYTDCKPPIFWNEMQMHLKIYLRCALLDVTYTDLYARKKSRNYIKWNYTIEHNH